MIVTKAVLVLSVAFLAWFYVVRPVVAQWKETEATGSVWARLWAAFKNFKTKAIARLTAIFAGFAPLLAAGLGEFDLRAFLAAYPWAIPLAAIALGVVIDFLRSFGKNDA